MLSWKQCLKTLLRIFIIHLPEKFSFCICDTDTVWGLHNLYQSKKEDKFQELIQSSTTPDTGYESERDNFTIIHHKREPRCQPFSSRRPQGINKQKHTKA